MSEQPPSDPYGTPPPQPPYGQQPPYPQQPPPAYQPPPGYGYAAPPPNHGSATTALILGILGIVLCPLVLSIPAIVVGRRAMREIDESQGRLGGRSSAQAGFITGIIGTVIGALSALAFIALFAFGAFVANEVEGCFDGTYDPQTGEYYCS